MRAALAVLLLALPAHAQSLLSPRRTAEAIKFFTAEPGERPLLCQAIPIRPALNFGLRYQAGYAANVPMNQYLGPGHLLILLIRITPDASPAKPIYLASAFHLPPIPVTKAELSFGGTYLLGEGSYTAELVVSDDQERFYRKKWRIKVAPSRTEKRLQAALSPGSVRALSALRWNASQPNQTDAKPLRLTILLHAAPSSPRSTRFRSRDQYRLLGSLSSLLEQVPTRSVRLVAFSLDQQRELYRTDDFSPSGFEELNQSLMQLELGVVDYHVLQNPTGQLDLLADLINQELQAPEPADAVVFLGPTARSEDRLRIIAPHSANAPRFTYFEYRPPFERSGSFPDTIELAVKKLGGRSIQIHSPAEFAKAVTGLITNR